ncbi:MAG: transporter substrate-binding domain-containing protein, partial [Campylobacteraceae bacterium]|nr:transporter substrate-binding domain-containing protein [Campylobacteraceae bacterium]
KIKILALKDSNAALQAVSDNKAYAMVEILPVAAHKIRQFNYNNLKISGTTEYNFEVKAFIRSDYAELVSIINKGIDHLGVDAINKISNKWLAIEYVHEIDYGLLVEIILFFTVLIIILVYIQNRKLKRSNKKLKTTLKNLKETREDLLASEKMATLGELVGGVTHEIISPLSVGIMGSSYITDMTEEISTLYNTQDMSEGDFRDYITDVSETSKSITLNLNRTKILVNSFKDVAVDQAFEDVRDFVVRSYVDEILLSMTSKLKQSKVKIIIECDEKMVVRSHPGYIAQILFNFINNSLTHGFSRNDEGEIHIIFEEKSLDKKLELIYRDNGKGVAKKFNHKVFDEFYTTKKGEGGTGLGLYIVKTIVENKLNGIISFKSEVSKGVEIKILIPLD